MLILEKKRGNSSDEVPKAKVTDQTSKNKHHKIYRENERDAVRTRYQMLSHPRGITKNTVGQVYWQVTMKMLSRVVYIEATSPSMNGIKISTLV